MTRKTREVKENKLQRNEKKKWQDVVPFPKGGAARILLNRDTENLVACFFVYVACPSLWRSGKRVACHWCHSRWRQVVYTGKRHIIIIELMIKKVRTKESLRCTTRRQRQRHKFCIFNEAKQKLCTLFTCLFISVHFFPVLGKSATWNDHFSSFTEKVNTQPPLWIFFPGFYTAPLNSVPG